MTSQLAAGLTTGWTTPTLPRRGGRGWLWFLGLSAGEVGSDLGHPTVLNFGLLYGLVAAVGAQGKYTLSWPYVFFSVPRRNYKLVFKF